MYGAQKALAGTYTLGAVLVGLAILGLAFL